MWAGSKILVTRMVESLRKAQLVQLKDETCVRVLRYDDRGDWAGLVSQSDYEILHQERS